MGRKKKGIGEDAVDSPAASTGAKGGKVMPMLLGAALVLAGGLGQRFVLANPPAEVIIAPPTEGVGSTGAGTSALDCSGYTKGYKDGTAPHARRAEGAAAAGGTSDLPSMTINLADGHYLKIGISLQLGATVVPVTRSRASPPVTSSGRADNTSIFSPWPHAGSPANAAPTTANEMLRPHILVISKPSHTLTKKSLVGGLYVHGRDGATRTPSCGRRGGLCHSRNSRAAWPRTKANIAAVSPVILA